MPPHDQITTNITKYGPNGDNPTPEPRISSDYFTNYYMTRLLQRSLQKYLDHYTNYCTIDQITTQKPTRDWKVFIGIPSGAANIPVQL